MKPWTDEEHGYLLDNMDAPAVEVAEHLGRTAASVNRRKNHLRSGWQQKKFSWTATEDALIMSRTALTVQQLAKEMPGRTPSAIQHRRGTLGVKAGLATYRDPHAIGSRLLLAKTCSLCGNLMPAGCFWWRSGVQRWQSECRDCSVARTKNWRDDKVAKGDKMRRSRAYEKAAQDVSAQRATRSKEEYTEADHAVLSDPSLTYLQKALRLERTYLGVKGGMQKYGYKSHPAVGDRERDAWLIDNPNTGRIEEITAELNGELVPAGPPAWDWDD